jgi:hypothetical protein
VLCALIPETHTLHELHIRIYLPRAWDEPYTPEVISKLNWKPLVELLSSSKYASIPKLALTIETSYERVPDQDEDEDEDATSADLKEAMQFILIPLSQSPHCTIAVVPDPDAKESQNRHIWTLQAALTGTTPSLGSATVTQRPLLPPFPDT